MASANISAIQPVIPPAPHMASHAGTESPEAGMAMTHAAPETPAPALSELAEQVDSLLNRMSQVMAQHPNPKQMTLLNFSRRFLHAAVAQSMAPAKTPAPAEPAAARETQQVPA